LNDAQYVVVVDQHLLAWKGEGKYGSALLKDEKTREKMQGFTGRDNPSSTTHHSTVWDPTIFPDVHVKSGMEHFVHFIPSLIILC